MSEDYLQHDDPGYSHMAAQRHLYVQKHLYIQILPHCSRERQTRAFPKEK